MAEGSAISKTDAAAGMELVTNLYLNVGGEGNPQFVESDAAAVAGATALPSDGVSYVLQHKVWAGTYEGFAKGLAIALVDWDGDGVCGRCDGVAHDDLRDADAGDHVV